MIQIQVNKQIFKAFVCWKTSCKGPFILTSLNLRYEGISGYCWFLIGDIHTSAPSKNSIKLASYKKKNLPLALVQWRLTGALTLTDWLMSKWVQLQFHARTTTAKQEEPSVLSWNVETPVCPPTPLTWHGEFHITFSIQQKQMAGYST